MTVAAPTDARLARLSLNQRTTAEWSLREAIDGATRAGLPAIGLWREPVAEVGLETARSWIEEAGLRVSSICRGGFFTDPAAVDAAYADNLRAIDETATLGAPTLVLVPGGLPGGGGGCRLASGTCRQPACAWRTPSRGWHRTRATPASRSASSRCTRSSPPTAA